MNTLRNQSIILSITIGLRLLKNLSVGITSALAPALGFFVRPQTCVAAWVCRIALSAVTGLSSWYIPTFVGSLILSTRSRILSIAIPLVCMGLFLMHPIGGASWLYTLYWLIPIGLSFIKPSILSRALISTYTTHAVGSVMWLYTHVTTPAYWHLLIAQVWYERLIYAAVLTGSYYVILYGSKTIRKVSYVSSCNTFFGTSVPTCYS